MLARGGGVVQRAATIVVERIQIWPATSLCSCFPRCPFTRWTPLRNLMGRCYHQAENFVQRIQLGLRLGAGVRLSGHRLLTITPFPALTAAAATASPLLLPAAIYLLGAAAFGAQAPAFLLRFGCGLSPGSNNMQPHG